MERVEFRNTSGKTLRGILHPSGCMSVVILVHGISGDKSESGKFDRLAEELNHEGYNVLRFDMSGFGESDDDLISVERMTDDLKSAISYASSLGMANIGLLGYSLGAHICCRVYDSRISTMVFWNPLLANGADVWPNEQQLKELQETGGITQQNQSGKMLCYDPKMVEEIASIQPGCRSIECPVMILHGDKDEIVDPSTSREAMKDLNIESEFHLIKGADHVFRDQVDEFIKPTVEFMYRHLEYQSDHTLRCHDCRG